MDSSYHFNLVSAYDCLLPYQIPQNEILQPHEAHGGHIQMSQPNGCSGNLSIALTAPIIQNTAVPLQVRRDFERYMREMYKSPLTPRSEFTHPEIGGYGNASTTLPPTSESLQREFERYMRETAPPALSPPPIPTNYIVVPQEVFSFPTSILVPPIEFTRKGWRHHVFGLQINLPPGLSGKQDIERSLDMVFLPSQGLRELMITIQWPGYHQAGYPFERRIRTKDGNITRGELFDRVCGVVVELSEMLKERDAAGGHAKWMVGKTGLDVDRFFIARLLHRGGGYFQPEIWVPRPREK